MNTTPDPFNRHRVADNHAGHPDHDNHADPRITSSLGRLATRMPEHVDDLAVSAMREAGSIRRRRTGMTVAGMAAALAIAVPLTWQLAGGRNGSLPANPGLTQTLTDTTASGSPSTSPTSTYPASPTTSVSVSTGTDKTSPAAFRAPVVVLDLTTAPTNDIVRPYTVGGIYHGESGIFPLTVKQLVGAVLNVHDGRVVHADGEIYVQDLHGTLRTSFPGRGVPLTNDPGDRFAFFDGDSRRLVAYTAKGEAIRSTEPIDTVDLAVVGWAGQRVLYTQNGKTYTWDTSTGKRALFADVEAVDANDRLGRVLLRNDNCWWVRTTKDSTPRTLSEHCGTGISPHLLSLDGQRVVGHASRTGSWDEWVVADVPSGKRLLTVRLATKPMDVTLEWRGDTQQIMLNIVTTDGAGRLAACHLDGNCEILTPTVPNPGAPEAPGPYILVHD